MPYEKALFEMEKRANGIIAGAKNELVWFLEHPPTITAGTSAKDGDLLDEKKFPVFKTGRGGEYTYHGPGQQVCYLMLDLKKRGMADLHKYVSTLEEIIIKTLAEYGITGERRKGRIGIWVKNGGSENKIAAIGVRVRRWVTMHGLAININPDLSHFNTIVPCGIKEFGVTSLAKEGKKVKDIQEKLKKVISQYFE